MKSISKCFCRAAVWGGSS
uniref:Uncharacterized protein n=1 Tax=Anguilla anguilla TaxID=7936 RepID=A0A0E9UAL9_ANGAN